MRRIGVAVGVLVLVSACASGPSSSSSPSGAASSAAATASPVASVATAPPSVAPSATPAPSVDLDHPVGIIAIGHSGLTGEGTVARSQPNLAQSWATGDDATIDSIYRRMLETWPLTEGHVSNTARGGAGADLLDNQAARALSAVPAPALAIVSTIDNDIQCDGSDPANQEPFAASVRTALERIHTASPNTQILVIGQLGRPDKAYLDQLVKAVPNAKGGMTGTGMCDFYDPGGSFNAAHLQALTDIIQSYEDTQAAVCAEIPNCQTDGGVRAAWKDKLEYFSPDYAHLNEAGQAAEAKLLWPVVAAILKG